MQAVTVSNNEFYNLGIEEAQDGGTTMANSGSSTVVFGLPRGRGNSTFLRSCGALAPPHPAEWMTWPDWTVPEVTYCNFVPRYRQRSTSSENRTSTEGRLKSKHNLTSSTQLCGYCVCDTEVHIMRSDKCSAAIYQRSRSM